MKFLALALLVLSSLGSAFATSKPNVVIIFIDDMGYGDIGPFGATQQKTPNLDRMAEQGMKLTSFYAAPVCSVSRAQLLTGCYGARISVPGVYGPGSANGLNPAEFTIAERLKEQGYATQCIGKWHVGDQPEFLPTKQGFDHYFGIPYSNDMQRKPQEGGERVVPLLRDDKVIELLSEEAQSSIVARYTEEALAFIRSSQDKPFFLYLPHTAVHTPIRPGDAFAGKSANGRFGDWVEEVDWSTGEILNALRELKLDEKTLVIFTSDNGPWLIKGADGGSAGPLRGGKGSTWEGGVRVPTLAWWPGQIKPGSVCDAVAGTIDLLPTCVSLAGGAVPAEPRIDGQDISPLLLGKSSTSPREAHYYFSSYNLQAVRQGPWKLAIASQPETMGKSVAADARENPRLYNLDAEINEQTNLADQHPDIVAHLLDLTKKMGAEIGGMKPTARRPAGVAEHPQTLYPTQPEPARGKKSKRKNKPTGKPISLEALKPGDALTSEEAPQIEGTPFTLFCVIETTQPDAIILAHGGLSAGYALALRAGHLVFTVRTGGKEAFTEINSPEVISGRAEIVAVLAKDHALSLSVNGQKVATGQSRGFIPRQPQENFCIGHDDAKPVTNYTAKGPFQGSITQLKITTP